jgi:predicted nucleic acid-binding protein
MIVSDTGPLIAFARLGRVPLLRQVVGIALIPDAVFDEIVTRGRGRPGSSEIAEASWIQRRTISDQEAVAQFPVPLHAGEREAILLAAELNAPLLIDEHRGRDIAVARELNVIGSLRILGEAKERGLIPAVRPLVAELLDLAYWLDEATIVRPFLRDMGEDDAFLT